MKLKACPDCPLHNDVDAKPLVTEAAYEILNDDMLFHISQAFVQGVVESGKRDEIAGKLILILICQKL
jgi:hypothetical protein